MSKIKSKKQMEESFINASKIYQNYVTLIFANSEIASANIDRARVLGWFVHFSTELIVKKDYLVTFSRLDLLATKWEIQFIGHVDNQYEIFVNDWDESVKKSKVYHNKQKPNEADKQFDLTDHLDQGENRIRIDLINLGGPARMKYSILRNGQKMQTETMIKAGSKEHIIKF